MTYLHANWPAPKHINALTSTRNEGFSKAPYSSNNLGLHVGDDEQDVLKNRDLLKQKLFLPSEPIWLTQTHSTNCIIPEQETTRLADAAVSRIPNTVLAIMTADCLPITLCNREGTEIAAIHAGWRGLAFGIIENTLAKMHSMPEELMAWIGPGICGACYEIGEEVKKEFIQRYPFTETAFEQKEGHLFAHLSEKAARILKSRGINSVYQTGACTFEQNNQFYSYRRQAQTGRMVTLIWSTTQDKSS